MSSHTGREESIYGDWDLWSLGLSGRARIGDIDIGCGVFGGAPKKFDTWRSRPTFCDRRSAEFGS